jgi:hypothetical protein
MEELEAVKGITTCCPGLQDIQINHCATDYLGVVSYI